MKTQTCTKCKQELPVSEFHKNSGTKSGRNSHCKKCKCESTRLRYDPIKKANYYRTHQRRKELHTLYKITIEGYNSLFKKQKGRCLICNKHQTSFSKRLSVDHDHRTGKIRGLLCNSCNLAIGLMKDDIKRFENAIIYLKQKQ